MNIPLHLLMSFYYDKRLCSGIELGQEQCHGRRERGVVSEWRNTLGSHGVKHLRQPRP